MRSLREIPLGTWLVLAGIAVAVLLDWGRFQQGWEMLRELNATMKSVRDDVREHDLEITDLQGRVKRIEDDRSQLVPQMYDRMGRIEEQLKRLRP